MLWPMVDHSPPGRSTTTHRCDFVGCGSTLAARSGVFGSNLSGSLVNIFLTALGMAFLGGWFEGLLGVGPARPSLSCLGTLVVIVEFWLQFISICFILYFFINYSLSPRRRGILVTTTIIVSVFICSLWFTGTI